MTCLHTCWIAATHHRLRFCTVQFCSHQRQGIVFASFQLAAAPLRRRLVRSLFGILIPFIFLSPSKVVPVAARPVRQRPMTVPLSVHVRQPIFVSRWYCVSEGNHFIVICTYRLLLLRNKRYMFRVYHHHVLTISYCFLLIDLEFLPIHFIAVLKVNVTYLNYTVCRCIKIYVLHVLYIRNILYLAGVKLEPCLPVPIPDIFASRDTEMKQLIYSHVQMY